MIAEGASPAFLNRGAHLQLPKEVRIREVGPREGFQILSSTYPTAGKLRIIEALVDSGLKCIEVTSFVRPDRLPQMADAEQLVAALPESDSVDFTALYLNRRGFERAEASGKLDNLGWIYTATSGSFLRANNNTTIEETLDGVREWGEIFSSAGKSIYGLMVSTAFGCHYEGEVSTRQLVELVARFVERCNGIEAPLKEVCLADTVGRGHPASVRAAVRAVRELGVEVSLHLHDTWGLGLVNAYAGLEEGVTIFESSIGGLGGCPFTPEAAGNIATEDLVYLCRSLGIETGIDLERCCRAARIAEEVVGRSLPGRVFRRVCHSGGEQKQ